MKVYNRDTLTRGSVISGPAIFEEASTVTIILPQQKIKIDKLGFLRIDNKL